MIIDGKDRQGQKKKKKKNKNKKNSNTRSHAVSYSLTTYQWTERLDLFATLMRDELLPGIQRLSLKLPTYEDRGFSC
jgi:hypothetical protein